MNSGGTISGRRLYQHVADQIAALVKDGDFGIGARLPPERDLATKLKVSRPTVREALIALEIAGLVEVRTGSGTYVCRQTSETEVGKDGLKVEAGPSAFELITARRIVEPAVAAEAAEHATPNDLDAIATAQTLCEMRWQASHYEMLEADRSFHLAIAAATHNETIARTVEALWKDMFSPIFAVLSRRTRLRDKKMLTLHDHRTLVSCIERRDPVGAHAAMLTHLVHAEMKMIQTTIAGDDDGATNRKDSRKSRRPNNR